MVMMARPTPGFGLGVSRDNKPAEVGLGHFAAMTGMTESEYVEAMFGLLESGRVADLMKLDAQVDFAEWLVGVAKSGVSEFLVTFRLSLNRKRDAALYCVCRLTGEGFFKMMVKDAIPGLIGAGIHEDLAPEAARGLEGFEVRFCDMETNLWKK